jgi:hypothetical protein
MSYGALFTALEPLVRTERASLWGRQMTLGPALEFCLHTNRPVSLPATLTALTLSCRQVLLQ